MINGLFHERAVKTEALKFSRLAAKNPRKDARDATTASLEAEGLEVDIKRLDDAIGWRAKAIEEIEALIVAISRCPHQSADLTLAIRDLENASSRINRELGIRRN